MTRLKRKLQKNPFFFSFPRDTHSDVFIDVSNTVIDGQN